MSSPRTDRRYHARAYRSDQDGWSDLEALDRGTRRWLASPEGRPPIPRALDLGCGRGRIVDLLVREGYEAVGIDVLKEPLESPGNGSRYVRGDAFALPFDADSFGLVVDYGLLHHVRPRDVPRYRREVSRVLVASGRMFLSVFHREDDHAERGGRTWVRHRGHYDRFFDQKALLGELGEAYSLLRSRTVRDGGHVLLHALLKYGDRS